MRLHPSVLTPLALAVLTLLTACQAPKSRSTYDEISREVASAARSAAPTATVDDAVANALVPPVSALAGNLPKARPALEERFNVAFRQVPAQQFFQSIVAGTRYNMLVHPDVTGTITANLKDVTLVETLNMPCTQAADSAGKSPTALTASRSNVTCCPASSRTG